MFEGLSKEERTMIVAGLISGINRMVDGGLVLSREENIKAIRMMRWAITNHPMNEEGWDRERTVSRMLSLAEAAMKEEGNGETEQG